MKRLSIGLLGTLLVPVLCEACAHKLPPAHSVTPPPTPLISAYIFVRQTIVTPPIGGRTVIFVLSTNATDAVSDWTFGDGTQSQYAGHNSTVAHGYTGAGDYTVTATVTDSSGRKVTASLQLTL